MSLVPARVSSSTVLCLALVGLLLASFPTSVSRPSVSAPSHVSSQHADSGALLAQARASLRAGPRDSGEGGSSSFLPTRLEATAPGGDRALRSPATGVWSNPSADVMPESVPGPSIAYDPALGSVLGYSGGATWNYTPAGWQRLTPTTEPPPRGHASLAFDASVDEMVLYGGVAPEWNGPALNDTWIFSNGTWTNVSAHDPPPSRGAEIAYDARDGYLLLWNGRTHPGTWKFEHGSWFNVTDPTALNPPRRSGAVFVYDARDGYVLLSAGTDGYGEYNDSWAYSSGHWFNITSGSVRPPARDQSLAAFDAADGYVLVAGGYEYPSGGIGPSAPWAFAQGRWWPINATPPSIRPCASYGAAATYFPLLNRVIVYGGLDSAGTPCTDVESYIDGQWARATGVDAPALFTGDWPDYSNEVMTYDAADGYVLLYGAGHSWPNETWTYRGGLWTQLHPRVSPPARTNPGIAYDAADGYVILYGGVGMNYQQSILNDSWTFHAGTWTNITNLSGRTPPPVWRFGMTYDSRDRYVLLFGGLRPLWNNYTGWNETWSFHGGVWTNRTAGGTKPPAGQGDVVADDSADGYVVLFGGSWGCDGLCTNWVFYNETWTYHAGVWTNRTTSVAPPVRSDEMLTSDPTSGDIILYGGDAWGGAYNDTWAFHAGSWSQLVTTVSPARDATSAFASDSADRMVLMVAEWWYPDFLIWGFQERPFTAAMTLSPAFGTSPVTVSANASANGGYPPFGANWTFGDGGSGTGLPANHLYSNVGQYRVSLNLTDAGGNWTRSDRWVTIGTNLAATISANLSPGVAPVNMSVRGFASGGMPPYSFTWTFGDGSSAVSGPNASHVYASPAAYLVVLSVRDSGNNISTATKTVTVTVPELADTLVVSPTAGDAPLFVNFTAIASGGTMPYDYNVSFGDGTWSNLSSVTHAYTRPGDYVCQMVVSDRFLGVNSSTVQVRVYAAPTVSARITPISGSAPLIIQVSAIHQGGLGPYSTVWNFGDGSSGLFINGSHVFGLPGTYNVTVRVTDVFGRVATSGELPITVFVPLAPLSVSVSADPLVGRVGEQVQFTAVAAGGSTPYSYEWLGLPSGCPTASLGPDVICSLTRSGTTMVEVRASGANGVAATAGVTFTVLANTLAARLEIEPLPASYGTTVNVTAVVSGGVSPYTFAWTVKPAGCLSSATSVVECSGLAPGVYAISVTAWDADSEAVSMNGTLVVLASPPTPIHPAAENPTYWFLAGAAVAVFLVSAFWLASRRFRARGR